MCQALLKFLIVKEGEEENLLGTSGGAGRRRGQKAMPAPGALPLHIRAQERDSQQEVHGDGTHHHGQSQQNGPVFSCFQSCDGFPFVQEVMVPDFLVNISVVENNAILHEVHTWLACPRGKASPCPPLPKAERPGRAPLPN